MEQFSELKNFTVVEPHETRVKTTGGQTIVMRIARKADFDAVDALLAQSYPKTLTGHYAPSVMALAMPKIARANMRLLRSGRYFLAQSESGRVLGAGGYSLEAPGGRRSIPGTAHIRHVVTDHAHQGRGIGRAILRHSLAFAPSPLQLLREADRVLSRRGQLLILNVAPWSIWGLGSRLPWRPMQLPQPMRLLGANRLADWLNLLDFRIEEAGSYGQALPEWTRRLRLGGVLRPGYYIHARKRRLPVRPLRSRWRAPAPAFGQVAMPPARSAARVISFPDTRT